MNKDKSSKKHHFDSWRIFRILSEFVDGFETMTDLGPSVSIFGSARIQPDSPYYQLTSVIAEKIANKGFGVITGGGPGIMEAANKGAQKGKGASCGISINLPYEEANNKYIDPKYHLSYRYFFVRKLMFIRYAQAFVFLPGGYGTLDELFEALTLIQTKKIRKFPIFLVGEDYWKGVVDWLKSIPLKSEYLNQRDFELFTLTDDPDFIANAIEKHYHHAGEGDTFSLE
ncbi:MAG: TIGR00730 family Rossman fold protein [Chlamydiales bacterium]